MCATPQNQEEIPVHEGGARLQGPGQGRAGLRRKVPGSGPGQWPRRASASPHAAATKVAGATNGAPRGVLSQILLRRLCVAACEQNDMGLQTVTLFDQ